MACFGSVYPYPLCMLVFSSLSNLEGTLDEELDYDETMETADLHLLELEDNIEGSPVATDGPVGDGNDDEADSNEHVLLQEVYNNDDFTLLVLSFCVIDFFACISLGLGWVGWYQIEHFLVHFLYYIRKWSHLM